MAKFNPIIISNVLSNNICQSWMNIILRLSISLRLNFSLISVYETCFCQWTNCSLVTIYIYMYLCFFSERQRRKKEKKEEDENKLRDGGNSSSFKKGRKDSIVDAKRDSWRSSERKGESKNHPWIDRFIICRRFVIRALPFFVCLWDRDIDAASCDDFRDSPPLWRRWQNG